MRPSEDDEEEIPHIHNLEQSWWNWLVWRFFDKKQLPFSGGFMEQPTWVINDIMTIEHRFNTIQEQMNGR